MRVVEPGAIAAAAEAEAQAANRRDQVRDAISRDLEAARYAADRAFRQYDAADPANRLVAAELERGYDETGSPHLRNQPNLYARVLPGHWAIDEMAG
ncbi:MAG: hypothetical protein AB7O43_17180 [Hyphomicrobiaceae bacterium]